MKALLAWAGMLLFAGLINAQPPDEAKKKEKDIFNIEKQKAAGKDVKKIVFVGDKRPHGPRGNHEFVAGPIYMARTLNAVYPNCYATVTTYDRFPKDLSQADAVIILINDGGPAVNPAMKEAMARGAGF